MLGADAHHPLWERTERIDVAFDRAALGDADGATADVATLRETIGQTHIMPASLILDRT
jgi:hypothetical protein